MKVPTFFKNTYVLYLLTMLGVINLLGYIAMENYDAMALLIIIFLLARYFSKNIAFNICIALFVTSIVTLNDRFIEGYTEDAKRKMKRGGLPSSGTRDTRAEQRNSRRSDIMNDYTKGKLSKADLKRMGQNAMLMPEKPKEPEKPKDPVQPDPIDPEKPKEKPEEEPRCLEGEELIKGECVPMRRGFQNNVPSSKPAKVSDADDDMNVAAKMEDAYGNLNKMLGDGAMKSMANETKKLVVQQKELMNTLSSMTPALNKAKETLKNLNLPNMEEMTGILKKFT